MYLYISQFVKFNCYSFNQFDTQSTKIYSSFVVGSKVQRTENIYSLFNMFIFKVQHTAILLFEMIYMNFDEMSNRLS